MALQYSTTVRNAELDAMETAISTAPVLRIYTGSPPADCATAASGTLLVSFALPSDWLAAASGGSKGKSGTWSGTASSAGTAGYFRIWNSGITTCHMQGTVTATGGGGDLTLNNTSIASSQTVTITSATFTAANS